MKKEKEFNNLKTYVETEKKLKEQNSKLIRKVFFILSLFWCLDFFTTIISLNFFGLKESNIYSNTLYLLGWKGYLFVFISSISFIFIISLFFVFIGKKFRNEKLFSFLGGLSFCGLEIYMIINNILLMVK